MITPPPENELNYEKGYADGFCAAWDMKTIGEFPTPAFQHVLTLAASVYVDKTMNLKEGTTSWLKENITPVEHDFLMSVFEKGL